VIIIPSSKTILLQAILNIVSAVIIHWVNKQIDKK